MDEKIYSADEAVENDRELAGLEDPVEEATGTGCVSALADLLPLYRVKAVHSSETECFTCPPNCSPAKGEHVVIQTRYGRDLGVYLGPVLSPGSLRREDIREIIRMADENDLARYEQNLKKEKEAYDICRVKISNHRLDMKLISAHYLLDEPKVLFFFTADSRVDFRDLVKDLVSVFKMRIELRQIGVRDEARITGGIGVCGRCFCCNSLSDKLRPVSIKMAKEQNLSLNSMKISGPCGRLLCCLSYEFDFYHDEKSALPSEGSKVMFDGMLFKITEVNVLSKSIRITGDGGRVVDLKPCDFERDKSTGRWVVRKRAACENC